MARNSGKNSSNDFGDAPRAPKKTDSRSNPLRWLSPYVDQSDTVWLQDHRDDIAGFVFGVLSELPSGYTVSSKFDNYSDRWLTTIICDRVDDPNRGIALTGRGSTRINSLYTCFYLAAVKLEWEWVEATAPGMGDFG